MTTRTTTISETLVSRYREQVGGFCLTSCEAKCCRKGKLISDVALIAKRKLHEGASVWLEIQGGCEFLSGNTCSIYKDRYRPPICADYPLFLRYKTLVIASDCTATASGYFTSLEEEAAQAGLTVRIQ